MKKLLTLFIILLFTLSATLAWSADSKKETKKTELSPQAARLLWSNMNSAGAVNFTSSPNLRFSGSAAQSVIGQSSSTNFKVYSGFWYGSETLVYKRGDVTGDGNISSGDIVFLINYFFKGRAAPKVLCTGDVTGDGNISSGDIVFLINYFFKGRPGPNPPTC